ncbi:MAG: hypothetical protein QM655_09470 [Nocardioidaceae bacterium]
MTMYRFAFAMLMCSVVCLAISAAYGLTFYIAISVVCTFAFGYFMAVGREQESPSKAPRKDKR